MAKADLRAALPKLNVSPPSPPISTRPTTRTMTTPPSGPCPESGCEGRGYGKRGLR